MNPKAFFLEANPDKFANRFYSLYFYGKVSFPNV